MSDSLQLVGFTSSEAGFVFQWPNAKGRLKGKCLQGIYITDVLHVQEIIFSCCLFLKGGTLLILIMTYGSSIMASVRDCLK